MVVLTCQLLVLQKADESTCLIRTEVTGVGQRDAVALLRSLFVRVLPFAVLRALYELSREVLLRCGSACDELAKVHDLCESSNKCCVKDRTHFCDSLPVLI